jgi:AcrR family transcriptional regulator
MAKEIKNTKNVKGLMPKDTANRILIQAMRIFLEKGYHGTSVDDITQAAGLTKGALYWHFRSK